MNKHTATYLDQVFTRNSKGRVYSHTVVARRSEHNALEYANEISPVDASNWAYYSSAKAYSWGYGSDYVNVGDDRYHSPVEFTAAFPTAESYQEYMRDCRVADFQKLKNAGEFDTFVNLGWCGRRELAEKLLRDTLAKRYWAEAVILDAEVN